MNFFFQAVKRSRVKSKQKAVETQGRVDILRVDNDKLESKIEEKRKQIQTLKDLFLETAAKKSEASSDQKIDLNKLLADDDDDDIPSSSRK